MPPLEAAIFAEPNPLDRAPAFRGGYGFRGDYLQVEMDLAGLTLEQVYPPPASSSPPQPASGQAPKQTPQPGAQDSPHPAPPGLPAGQRLLHTASVAGHTFNVATDSTDIFVRGAWPSERTHRIECDIRFHGLSQGYRNQVAAFSSGDRLVVAYSFENSRQIHARTLDLELNQLVEWAFDPGRDGPSLPNRVHMLHVPILGRDYLLVLRADGGLWLLDARSGQLADSLDTGTTHSHAASVQLLWHPEARAFALLLLENEKKRGGLYAGRVEDGDPPRLRLISQDRMMKNAKLQVFAAALGEADRGSGSHLAVLGERVFVYGPQEGWRAMSDLPLPLDLGRLGENEYAALLPGGKLEIWRLSAEPGGGLERQRVEQVPGAEGGVWRMPNWGDLLDGFNPDILVPSYFLPARPHLLLVKSGGELLRLERHPPRLVPHADHGGEMNVETTFLPASLRHDPASGWWWLASVGKSLGLAGRDTPLARSLVLLNLRGGSLREVWREEALQPRFHLSQDNLNSLAMGMFLFGEAGRTQVCFASERGLNFIEADGGRARLWEAPFGLRPGDQEWMRFLRPLFRRGQQPGSPPAYLALADSAWLAAQDHHASIVLFDERGRLVRRMETGLPVWMPAWRNTRKNGFPYLVAKSMGRLLVIDPLEQEQVREEEVEGSCYGGLPMDMPGGELLFLGDNTPHLWTAAGERRWVGGLSSDGFNRLGAPLMQQGASYLWQPAATGEHLIFNQEGLIVAYGHTGFSDLGRHSLSFSAIEAGDQRRLVVALGRNQGRGYVFGLDPFTGTEAFRLALPKPLEEGSEESMPLLQTEGGHAAIWFLTSRGLLRVVASRPAEN